MGTATRPQQESGTVSERLPVRRLLPIAWYGFLLLVTFGPVLGAMAYQWQSDEDMSHGFFVPILAAYVAWDQREKLNRLRWTINPAGIAIVAFGAIQLWVATLGAELFLQRTSFLITLIGLIVFFGGTAAVRALAFPLILLFAMVPIPGIVYKQITFPLQLLASSIAERILELLGHVVIRDGNILELTGLTLSVVEACSGLRALFSLVFFSLIYGYLFESRKWIRWLLLAATIPVAVTANLTRIVLTGVLGSVNQEIAGGVYHIISGWVLFVLSIVLLVGIQQVAGWFGRFGRRQNA
jgi:exosortase